MPKRRRKKKPITLPAASPRMFGPLRLPQETLWFVLMNVLDYFMTYIVLYYSQFDDGPLRQRIVESNPIAAYFIDRWGVVKGLVGFKLGMVALICLITQRIALHQPRTARWVLSLGTLLTAAVVLYSLSLLLQASR